MQVRFARELLATQPTAAISLDEAVEAGIIGREFADAISDGRREVNGIYELDARAGKEKPP